MFETVSDLDRHGIPIKTVCCARCGLIFVNPRPNEAWIADFYRNHYRELYEEVTTPTREYAERPIMTWKHTQAIQLVSAFLPDRGNLLDIGAAEGTFLRLFRDEFADWQLAGIEPNARFVEFAKEEYGIDGIEVGLFPKDLENSENFDLIHTSHVLEHILDPLAFLAACRERLADRGLIYVEVPNALNFRKSHRSAHIAHLFHYDPHSLHALLAKAGFEVLELRDDLVVPSRKKEREMPLNLMALARKADGEVPGPEGRSREEIRRNVRRLRRQWRMPLLKRLRLAIRPKFNA